MSDRLDQLTRFGAAMQQTDAYMRTVQDDDQPEDGERTKEILGRYIPVDMFEKLLDDTIDQFMSRMQLEQELAGEQLDGKVIFRSLAATFWLAGSYYGPPTDESDLLLIGDRLGQFLRHGDLGALQMLWSKTECAPLSDRMKQMNSIIADALVWSGLTTEDLADEDRDLIRKFRDAVAAGIVVGLMMGGK